MSGSGVALEVPPPVASLCGRGKVREGGKAGQAEGPGHAETVGLQPRVTPSAWRSVRGGDLVGSVPRDALNLRGDSALERSSV